MKRITAFIFIIIVSQSIYASGNLEIEPNYAPILNYKLDLTYWDSINDLNKEYSFKRFNLQLDVAGIVFFGPQVAIDYQFMNRFMVGPYLRWHSMGAVYKFYYTNDISLLGGDSDPTFNSYSFGGQFKYMLNSKPKNNRTFVGLGYEKSIGVEYHLDIIHLDIGYRYSTLKAFNISFVLNMVFGFNLEMHYEQSSDYLVSDDILFLPNIQIVLGWQVGN